MANLIAATSAFAACAAGGAVLAKKRAERVCFFSALCDFNSDYLKEIGFSRGRLEQLFLKEYASEAFCSLLTFYGKKLFGDEFERKKRGDDSAKKSGKNLKNLTAAISGVYNRLGLDDDCVSLADGYFCRIGKSDAKTCEQEGLRYAQIFSELKKKSEEVDGKYKALYKKLGVIAGLAAFVIVI